MLFYRSINQIEFGSTDMEVTKSGDNINVDLREVFVRRAGGLK
jgi:hypothetical protein